MRALVPGQCLGEPRDLVGHRALDLALGQQGDVLGCIGIEQLAPHGSYEVQAVVADLSFLSPPGMPRDRIVEISIGPIGNVVRLTGVDGGVYVRCIEPFDTVECRQHAVFQLYRAMNSDIIEVDRLVISAQTSAFPKSTPRNTAAMAGWRAFDACRASIGRLHRDHAGCHAARSRLS
jgi:hypothetical protein